VTGGFHGLGRSPERACRKIEQWPATDRRLFEDSLVPGDLLEPGGSRAKYRAISNRRVERGYGRFLTFCERAGLLDDGPPADRITRDAVAAYVFELQQFGNSTNTILSRLQDLHEAALVMDPAEDWTWIRRVAARIRAQHKPARDKGSKMVGSDDLVALGSRLMEEAEQLSTPRLRAIQFRDGLLIALVALRPLRRKNLTELEIGRHLIRIGAEWHIVFQEDETKTGTPLEYPFPDALVHALERYLEHHRRVLCGLRGRWTRPVGEALWVSCNGSPMSEEAIYDQITGRTKAAFGTAVNPHLFRDIAATTLAHADPERVRAAAPLLGHRSFATTEHFYLRANIAEATRRHQEVILRLRRGGHPPQDFKR